jgi:hypothetical protein
MTKNNQIIDGNKLLITVTKERSSEVRVSPKVSDKTVG